MWLVSLSLSLCSQRSDIAMAIAKNDMFDFLIDIVPREEIQSKSRTSIGNSTATSTRLNQVRTKQLGSITSS